MTLTAFAEALKTRNRGAINAAALDLIEQRANLGSQWQAIANVLMHHGEINAALRAIDLLVEASANDGHARFAQAAMLAQAGRLDAATTVINALPDAVPDKASNAFFRGTLALNRGDGAKARASLLDAVTVSPALGQAWLALSELVDFRAEAALFERLAAAARRPSRSPIDAASLGYALGRAHHQIGDYKAAFESFVAGATIISALRPPSPAPTEDEPGDWSPDLLARSHALIRRDTGRIVFVSGLPRSGSTLVEQILASHPDVAGGGELGLFRLLGEEIGGLDAASFTRWLDRGGDPDALVQTYFHLIDERFGAAGHIVDKSLEASNYMGLLLALFPQSAVIWMRRDAIDCGWSAFRTYFARGVEWSSDLGAIGRRLAREDRVFAGWRAAVGERITALNYETLVRDPEQQIARLAAAAGLPPDRAMFSPHDNARAVVTASVGQVRRQINLDGLGVADPYRAWLGPMIDAYCAA